LSKKVFFGFIYLPGCQGGVLLTPVVDLKGDHSLTAISL